MSKYILALAIAAIAASAAAKPPRVESPAPRDILALVGSGNTDAELERSIAAANAHPLGSAENPIRVAGPEGSRTYIRRLRCSDGSEPRVGREAEGGVGGYGSVVALYRLDCGGAAPGKVDLRVDIYHAEHVETRAPAGFRLER